ncbi:uncharacterized protein LOC114286758 [Camellia sinensis]|uniref:uncharacterized protein LOC114286758 n=1 Tax=Camellia sinensis TaxID=4442 RepID=UPI001035FE32|nr:uncharacterized protein LOC114286758 [Camellia sinensis]
MKPPTFYSGIEPLKAVTWLLEMEKLYEVFPCTETQKVLLATYTLKDKARRDRKVSEFQELKYRIMSVAEYEAKFTELARFARHMVDTDYKKARKFEGGLDLEIFDRVAVLKLPTYVEVLDRALTVEATIAAKKQTITPTTEWRGKRTRFSFKKGRSVLKRQNIGSSSSSSQSNGSTPNCPDCEKRHKGTCYQASGTCFRCGKTSHMVRDCPMRFNEVSRPMTSSTRSVSAARPNARVDVRRNANNETLRQERVFAFVMT